MEHRLKVQIDQVEPGAKDVRLHLTAGDAEFDDILDDVVFQPLWALPDALSSVLQVGPPVRVRWLIGAPEGEVRIEQSGEQLELQVWTFPDHRRGLEAKGSLHFSFRGSREEIVIPFWRALRRLETLWRPEGLAFPTPELDALTRLVRSARTD